MNVICFGDSNTWGYDPRSYWGDRYEVPWPDHLAKITGWNVVNWGQNGREIPREMPPYSCDLLIVMLGTNDLLQGCTPEQAAARMDIFLNTVNTPVLLVAPPAMVKGEWVQEDSLILHSHQLAAEYAVLSANHGIPFCDATQWNIPLCFDGVHFTEAGHITFAENIRNHIVK